MLTSILHNITFRLYRTQYFYIRLLECKFQPARFCATCIQHATLLMSSVHLVGSLPTFRFYMRGHHSSLGLQHPSVLRAIYYAPPTATSSSRIAIRDMLICLVSSRVWFVYGSFHFCLNHI